MARKITTTPTGRTLVEAVKAYAMEHYNDGGWDVIVEAWDDSQILETIGRARTEAGAIKNVAKIVAIYGDRQADAVNSSGELESAWSDLEAQAREDRDAARRLVPDTFEGEAEQLLAAEAEAEAEADELAAEAAQAHADTYDTTEVEAAEAQLAAVIEGGPEAFTATALGILSPAARKPGKGKTGHPVADREIHAAKVGAAHQAATAEQYAKSDEAKQDAARAQEAGRPGAGRRTGRNGLTRRAAPVAEEVGFTKPADAEKSWATATPAEKSAARKAVRPTVEATLPKGYAVRWFKGAFDLAKKGDGADADGADWLVVCTTHGTTTPAPNTTEANLLGRKVGRQSWCAGCQ